MLRQCQDKGLKIESKGRNLQGASTPFTATMQNKRLREYH